MRAAIVFCSWAVLAAACTREDVRLRGTLAEGARGEPLFVSVGDSSGRTEVRDGAFALSGLPAGPVELRIGTGEDDDVRMRIGHLPAGASLSLERIRLDPERELAFPAAVHVRGAERVTINGVRFADPDALPGRVDAAGVVLARGKEAGALVVRPASGALPDLPVVLTPSTLVMDGSGGTASLDDVSPGDAVHVEGQVRSGYVHADRVTLRDADAGAAPDRAADASSGGSRGSARARDPERARDPAEDAEPEERRGAGRARPRTPEGHRPPPGECRDWDPGLPPGQQPPPRKC